jgi:hypothetical protein
MEKGVSRKVIIIPAYDKRDPDPKKSYGIGSATLVFGLDGSDGCVRFQITTGWHLPHNQEEITHRFRKEQNNISNYFYNPFLPYPSDLSYHSRKQIYSGDFHDDHCEWLNGEPCWFMGSSTNAQRIFDIMVREGDEAMWKELEKFYDKTFRVVKE